MASAAVEAHALEQGTVGDPGGCDETIDSFEALLNGDLDDLPEQAFYMVGSAEDAQRKAAELRAQT